MNEIVYNILTNDFRTSLWQGFADQYGSICHVRTNKRGYRYETANSTPWESQLQLFRQGFGIPSDERIIFHRDNTFLSEKHNQGLVITDKRIYFIEDNDYPLNKISFSWEDILQVKYIDNSMSFYLNTEKFVYINIKFFTKKSSECGLRTINEIGLALQDVFNYIIDLIN